MDANDCYDGVGRCIKCPKCGCTTIDNETTDTLDYIVREQSQHCHDCQAFVGYWAHGYYDPEYSMGYMKQKQVDQQMIMFGMGLLAMTVIVILTMMYTGVK